MSDLRPSGECDDSHDCIDCGKLHFSPASHARDREWAVDHAGEVIAATFHISEILDDLTTEVASHVLDSLRAGIEDRGANR